jgi:hypothetical protein
MRGKECDLNRILAGIPFVKRQLERPKGDGEIALI